MPQQLTNGYAWLEVFTRLSTDGVPNLEYLEKITTPDVRFRDPFNDLMGRPDLQLLLEHTLRQVKDARFKVLDTAVSEHRMYVKWMMTGKVRFLGVWQLQGMSELVFDAKGKLKLHQDYWDAAENFYSHLPFIGWLLRRIRSRASL